MSLPECSIAGLIAFAPSFVVFVVPWVIMLRSVPAKKGIVWRERALYYATSSTMSVAPPQAAAHTQISRRERACRDVPHGIAFACMMHTHPCTGETVEFNSPHLKCNHGFLTRNSIPPAAVASRWRSSLPPCLSCRVPSTLPHHTSTGTPCGRRCGPRTCDLRTCSSFSSSCPRRPSSYPVGFRWGRSRAVFRRCLSTVPTPTRSHGIACRVTWHDGFAGH